MHERRNNVLVFGLATVLIYALAAWLIIPDNFPNLPPGPDAHRIIATGLVVTIGLATVFLVFLRDKMDDELAKVVGKGYFEQEGLCFFPATRVRTVEDKQVTELCLYYQNRFAGTCEAVIHFKPAPGTVYSHKGASDIHFAFRAGPGEFGVIHQPIAVHRDAQGQVVDLKLGAAVRWPGLKGEKLRSRPGRPCGTFNVDWSLAHRLSRYELCGDIELIDPVGVHLGMPTGVVTDLKGGMFKQEVRSFFTKDSERLPRQSPAA